MDEKRVKQRVAMGARCHQLEMANYQLVSKYVVATVLTGFYGLYDPPSPVDNPSNNLKPILHHNGCHCLIRYEN